MTSAGRPFILGLTGSIAMGKSTVAAMFADCGVPVFDADAEVRAMQGPGGELLPAIETVFSGTTGPAGLDRQMLGAMVFADKDALAQLEAIVHPAVAARREAFLAEHEKAPIVLFDIPLLFEKTGAETVDAVVVVSAPPEIQRARALARDGMTEQKFEGILARQLPDATKRSRADYVIDTGTSLAQTQQAVEELVDKLNTLPGDILRE